VRDYQFAYSFIAGLSQELCPASGVFVKQDFAIEDSLLYE